MSFFYGHPSLSTMMDPFHDAAFFGADPFRRPPFGGRHDPFIRHPFGLPTYERRPVYYYGQPRPRAQYWDNDYGLLEDLLSDDILFRDDRRRFIQQQQQQLQLQQQRAQAQAARKPKAFVVRALLPVGSQSQQKPTTTAADMSEKSEQPAQQQLQAQDVNDDTKRRTVSPAASGEEGDDHHHMPKQPQQSKPAKKTTSKHKLQQSSQQPPKKLSHPSPSSAIQPFTSSLVPGFPSLYDSFFGTPSLQQLQLQPPSMSCSLMENDQAFVVTADLPGVSAKNINVSIVDRPQEQSKLLVIQAERKYQHSSDNDDKQDASSATSSESPSDRRQPHRYHFVETGYGSIQRSFRLPASAPCNTDHIKCQLQNGVLTVTIPKHDTAIADAGHSAIDTSIAEDDNATVNAVAPSDLDVDVDMEKEEDPDNEGHEGAVSTEMELEAAESNGDDGKPLQRLRSVEVEDVMDE